MMKTLALGVSLLALATSTASAGGIDRSGQWITPIFDKGNVVQFSIGSVDPVLNRVCGSRCHGVFGYNRFCDTLQPSQLFDQASNH